MWAINLYNARGEPLGPLELGPPLEIPQYEHYPLALHLDTDEGLERFQLVLEGEPLERRGAIFYFGSNTETRARVGEVEIIVHRDGEAMAVRRLAHTEAHFSAERYQFLVRDLKRLLSLASQDLTAIRSADESWECIVLVAQEERLQRIEEYVAMLVAQVGQIARAPRTAVQKQYRIARHDGARRIDARTIQWAATNGATRPGQVLTYSHETTCDLYENRVVAHIIDWLQPVLSALPERYAAELVAQQQQLRSRLQELELVLSFLDEGDSDDQVRKRFRERQRGNFAGRVEELERLQRDRLPDYRARVARCRQKLVGLRSQPPLNDIGPQAMLAVKPTLVLLRDPAYRVLYDGYLAIRQAIQTEELQQIEALLDHVPVERTSKLYEYWVFLQLYNELRRMGFADAPGSSLQALIDRRSFRLRSNGYVELIGDEKLYTNDAGTPLMIRLYYERRLGEEGQRCPDIYIEFSRKSTIALVLDAKYRNYRDPTSPRYETDIDEVALHKYLRLEQRRGDRWESIAGLAEQREQIKASFIVHSSEVYDQHQFRDYGSEGRENQYGSIPLVPDEAGATSDNLRLLLSMFMRVHLRILDVCWSIEHSVPHCGNYVKEIGGTKRKFWEWQYSCPACENSWWVNHCGHCGREIVKNILKITFSDPADNFYVADNRQLANGQRLMKCARCDRSYYNAMHHHH